MQLEQVITVVHQRKGPQFGSIILALKHRLIMYVDQLDALKHRLIMSVDQQDVLKHRLIIVNVEHSLEPEQELVPEPEPELELVPEPEPEQHNFIQEQAPLHLLLHMVLMDPIPNIPILRMANMVLIANIPILRMANMVLTAHALVELKLI